MPTSPGGPLVHALDALWARIQHTTPDLPDVRIAVTSSTPAADHGPERWTEDTTKVVSGLIVSTATLDEGAEAVLTHLLHEAAHVINWRRNVKDTTMHGAYHNQRYAKAATDLGLTWPEGAKRSASRGYADLQLTDEIRARYAVNLANLSDVIPLELRHLAVPEATSRPDHRLSLRCKCRPRPRTFRISQRQAACGPIVCGVCKAEFTAE